MAPVEFTGVLLQPPTDDQRPTLTAAEAEAICYRPDTGCRRDAGPLTTALAAATTDSGGIVAVRRRHQTHHRRPAGLGDRLAIRMRILRSGAPPRRHHSTTAFV